ncbi:MAG: hydroxymethylglutaryl-CoA reductase [Candidatus Aenigmarchaeota archaeon]|nr:hydroxymethylglutaryl-CoA reductase [Candidatus Aenigmarchaeota archaeon]
MEQEQINDLVEKLESGAVKLHEVENFTANDSNAATIVRRVYLEKKLGFPLKHIGSTIVDFNDSISRNIENPIGAVQIPLGYAGDMKINGDHVSGTVPILMATTEGRLVAGVARGITVANRAGGVNVSVLKDGMTRDVLVRTGGAKESATLAKWIMTEEGFNLLKEGFSKTTKHGKLKEVRPYVIGRDTHLRFKAETGAAMGMNMLTIAGKAAVDYILPKLKEKGINAFVVSESGNLCSDKKPAFINVIEGRGVTLTADIVVPPEVLKERFRVSAAAIADLCKSKNLIGSALAGSHGFNAHFANILASMFMAFGQDVAQIVEGSQGVTDAAVLEDGSLYFSCYLPAIEVGTYGGGTKRETQKEALKIMGLYGENDPEGITRLKLAEIIGAACLIGDLNLLAIQAAGELSKTHGSIKRG